MVLIFSRKTIGQLDAVSQDGNLQVILRLLPVLFYPTQVENM